MARRLRWTKEMRIILNDEIGFNDEGNGEDETYKDVMKDFSNFASSQPRMLRNRNYSTLESQRFPITNFD